MKKIQLLLAVLLASVCSIGMRAQTDVTSQYLQNADLMSLKGWSYGDNGHDYTDWRTDGVVPIIEHWDATKTFHLTQEVTLPAGTYRFVVHAFYREGENGNGTNDKAYMVIGENQKYVHALTSDEFTFNNSFDGGSDKLRAATAFSLGYYDNTYDFTLENEQTITLGVRGTITTASSWFIHGPFKLYTYTFEDYINGYDAEVDKAEALYGKPMSASVLAELQAAVVSNSTLTTSALAIEAIATLKEAITKAQVSISAYARLLDAINQAKAYALKCYANGAPETDALDAYETAYNNGTVIDSEVDAKIAEIKGIMVTIGSSQPSWQRMAPMEPTVNLTNGGEYYLYNVGYDNAVHYNAGASTWRIYPRSFISHATKVTITPTDDGYYTIKLTDANKYFYRSSSSTIEANSSSKTLFAITEVDGGYTFQTPQSSYYNENQYMGFVSGYDELRGNATTNIVWKILPAEEASFRYIEKLRLYNALCETNKYHFYVDNYEVIYDNEASTNAELNAATNVLNKSLGMSVGYKSPWWNERPILFYTEDGSFGQNYYSTWALPNSNTSGTSFYRYLKNSGETSSISATVLIEEPSTLVYSLSDDPTSLDVYLDGELVRHFGDQQCNHYPSISNDTYSRFFLELSPGLHTITWTQTALAWRGYSSVYLRNIGVMASPQIMVNLLEPGSLGTEVLYNTDHIKNVRRLKVKGAMNADDWARIKMMSTLLELDLSEAQFTEIPAQQFRVYSNDTTMVFLHKVSLPEGLKQINQGAFYYSFVEEVNFPSTLQGISNQAFYGSHIREVDMPDDLTWMGTEVFEEAYWLTRANLPKNLETIPEETFNNCNYLNNVVLPEKLETVNRYAFHECHRLQTILPDGLKTVGVRAFEGCWWYSYRLPEGLKTISEAAFNNTAIDSLFVPSSVTSIGEYAFCNNTNLKYAELSVEQYTTPKGIFDNTPKLEVLKLNSATVVSPTISNNVYPHRDITQLTLKVPHYLVNSYKLHSYWYNAKAIEPFDYSDVEYIPIHENLTLNHERFGGQPSIRIYWPNYLKINGENEQKFNQIWVGSNAQLLNNCDNVTAVGDNGINYWTDAKKWYYISLPFDLDMSRIKLETAGAQCAIRYYDGAGRAANGKSGNWKNVDRTGIIPAGSGFIYQTNVNTNTQFVAAETENKYGTLRTTEFNKTLAVNASETASNRGWNLVGNPYQCYYNNHCLNFTAPITVWNGSTYVAYSLTDDDYAIRPNEAFFVQCPNEEYTTLGFPIQGRQLTSVIESQNAVKAMTAQTKTRQVVNLTISNGETEDMTRVVLNESASLAYEVNRDASKFMSMDESVPQLYTLDEEGTQYAINERPIGDGSVALGFYVGKDGNYTIAVSRCDAESVFITDNLTGETIDITNGAYNFSAKAGTDNTRFILSFVSHNATAIQEVDKTGINEKADVFSLDGKFLGTDASRLDAGVYIIRQGKKVRKVIIR